MAKNEERIDNRPYLIVQNTLIGHLVDLVNKHIERGYEPHGGVFIARDGHNYCQAIYKKVTK